MKTGHPLSGAASGGNVLALALLATVAFAAPAVSHPGVRIENGIVYATTEGASLKLDAYLPAAPGLHPGVIVIHGGGWYTGTRSWDQELGVELAQDGFVAFGVDYRLAPAYHVPGTGGGPPDRRAVDPSARIGVRR